MDAFCSIRVAVFMPFLWETGLAVRDLYQNILDRTVQLLYHNHSICIAKRLQMIAGTLNQEADGYVQLLSNNNVLVNAADEIISNMKYVKLLTEADLRKKLRSTDTLIFEAGQGLLLDRNNAVYAPYVTASDTGLTNPCRFLAHFRLHLDEVAYVSHAYITRHGAGPLPNECPKTMLGNLLEDRTNEPNAWQGTLRYGRHENEEAFVEEVQKDIAGNCANKCCVSLFLTHLNETDSCIVMKDERVSLEDFISRPLIAATFDTVYTSASECSEDTILVG